MNKTIFILLCFLFSSVNGNSQENIKIKILKGLFKNIQVDNFKNEKFISTVARNKFASIPLSETHFKVIKLNNEQYAIVFNIFLAENEDDYKNMLNADIYNFMDILPNDPLSNLTKNERLIQVLIYDLSKNKFIAKASNFPIEKLSWRPTGMGDLTQYENLSDIKTVDNNQNSFFIRIDECPDCEASYYFFYAEPNKLKSSKKFSGCFENIKVENDAIVADKITNCYEVTFDNEAPNYKRVMLLNIIDN